MYTFHLTKETFLIWKSLFRCIATMSVILLKSKYNFTVKNLKSLTIQVGNKDCFLKTSSTILISFKYVSYEKVIDVVVVSIIRQQRFLARDSLGNCQSNGPVKSDIFSIGNLLPRFRNPIRPTTSDFRNYHENSRPYTQSIVIRNLPPKHLDRPVEHELSVECRR